MKRGDIYYERNHTVFGTGIQGAGRPVLILSANPIGETVMVAPITKNPTRCDNTNTVEIQSTRFPSTVLLENIRTISTDTLGDYLGKCTVAEMAQVNYTLMGALGLRSRTEDCANDTKADTKALPQETVRSIPDGLLDGIADKMAQAMVNALLFGSR